MHFLCPMLIVLGQGQMPSMSNVVVEQEKLNLCFIGPSLNMCIANHFVKVISSYDLSMLQGQ